MKIGFQIEHLDPARGGAETYVYRFGEQLLANGHEVHFIAASFGKSLPGAFTHRIMLRGLTRWTQDLRFARSADRAARRAKLDVVVATGRTYGANVLQPHGGTFRGSHRQNILRLGGVTAKGLKRAFDAVNPRVIMQCAIEGAQYAADPPPQVVALSQMVRADMKQFYNVPDERLHVIYNGVDLDRFDPKVCAAKREEARRALGLQDAQTCFLLVGHNFRLKGLRELVKSAARLKETDGAWRVVVVGKGNPRPYQRLTRSLGCGEWFVFPGAAADILPLYGASDVCVLPTWYDPCSLVTLEALACGRPVITTRFNGAAELMEDGREGFLLSSPAGTVPLAHAMEQMLDADVRAAMGQAARRTAEEHPLARNFREMMAVFEAAAAR